jgi:signal-transduction protein with cAMP-binding, CBS, and nucleotidyltransferase domain
LVGDTLRAFDIYNKGVITRDEYDACMSAIKNNRYNLSPSDVKAIVHAMDVVKYLDTVLKDPEKRQTLLDSDSIKIEKYKPGEVIIRQDDQGFRLYLCEEGEVSCIADGKDVGSCVPGGSFGKLSLVYGSPRAATCVASSNSLLWKVDRFAFKFLLVQAVNRHNANVMTVVNYLQKALTDSGERIVLSKILRKKPKKAGEII